MSFRMSEFPDSDPNVRLVIETPRNPQNTDYVLLHQPLPDSGGVVVLPGILYTQADVDQVLQEKREADRKAASLQSRVAQLEDERRKVQAALDAAQAERKREADRADRLAQVLAAASLSQPTQAYEWDKHSLPFEDPEGPFPTDLPSKDDAE